MKKLLVIFFAIVFLFMPCLLADAKAKKTMREVDITTSDSLVINATVFLPKAANAKNKAPLAIFLPSLGGSKTDYYDIAQKLSASGIASVAINPRGHTLSNTKTNGHKIFWQTMSLKQYAKYPNDIGEIIDYLNKNYVAINTNKYAIVASDITANASIVYSSKATIQPKKLILFSPSLSFKGLDTAVALVKYGEKPVIIIVSQKDSSHYKDALELKKYAQGEFKMMVMPSGGTGDYLMRIYNTIEPSIFEELKKSLI